MTWLDDLFDFPDLTVGVNLLGLSRGRWFTAEYTLHASQRLANTVRLSPGATVSEFPGGVKGGPLSSSATRRPSCRTVGALMNSLMADYAQAIHRAFKSTSTTS